MITCHQKFLVERCLERGYTLAEVLPCVVARDGDIWTIDTDSPHYPKHPKAGPVAPPAGGPGTELKALLAAWGITSSPTCSCNARAAEMDRRGSDWCASDEGMKTILGWLREEATKRRLPFVEAAAKLLVRRAIAKARKKTPPEGH